MHSISCMFANCPKYRGVLISGVSFKTDAYQCIASVACLRIVLNTEVSLFQGCPLRRVLLLHNQPM